MARVLAVMVGACAMPLASVLTVAVSAPPGNEPDAPKLGSVNVTATPATGADVVGLNTEARNGEANAVPMSAVCPPPPLCDTRRKLPLPPPPPPALVLVRL